MSAVTSAERRLLELGIELPAAPTPFGSYMETVETGNLLFFSGMLPVVDHKPKYAQQPTVPDDNGDNGPGSGWCP